MSQNKSYVSRQIPKHDDTMDWHQFTTGVWDVLITETPHVYDDLKNGIEPDFVMKPLDQYRKVAKRTGIRTPTATTPPAVMPLLPPDIDVNVPQSWIIQLSAEELSALPVWTFPPETWDADAKDAKYFYKLGRNPDYFGMSGESVWKAEATCIIRSKYHFENYEKKKGWNLLYNSLSVKYQSQLILEEEYTIKLKSLDYKWLWKKIKFLVTGEGFQSLPLLFARLFKLRMSADNFVEYSKQFVVLKENILSLEVPAEELLENLFNTLYHIGLTGPTNTLFKHQLEEIFSKNVWPKAEVSIALWSKQLTTLLKVEEAYGGQGVISANYAKSEGVKRSFRRSGQGSSAHAKTMCWNCWQLGHLCTNCKEPISKCDKCGGAHHTLAHETIKTSEARSANRSKPSFSESLRAAKKVSANMTVEPPDDTFNDEQYESMSILMANQAEMDCNNDIEQSATDEPEVQLDAEQTESIFGFQLTISNYGQPDGNDDDEPSHVVADDDNQTDDDPPPLIELDEDSLPPLVDAYGYPFYADAVARVVYIDDPLPYDYDNNDVDDDDENDDENTVISILSQVAHVEATLIDAACVEETHVEAARIEAAHVEAAHVEAAHVEAAHVEAAHVEAAPLVIIEDEDKWTMLMNRQRVIAYAADDFSENLPDIKAYLDTAAGGHIFRKDLRFHSMFTKVTASKGIVIEGVNEQSVPTPVEFTGTHYLIGHVYFADIRNCLISLPRLLKKSFSIIGKDCCITVSDDKGDEVFASVPDHKGLYPVNLTQVYGKSLGTKQIITAYDGTLVQAPPMIDTPMSAIEIQRAKDCRQLHIAAGHPSDSTMTEALDNGVWPMTELTSRDLKAANRLLGPCSACIEGKMVNPSEPSTNELRASEVGELIYLDLLKPFARCIGGHTQALVTRDYVSSYITVNGMRDKTSQSIIQTVLSIIAFYASYGHTVKVLVCDHEQTFVAIEHKIPGVRVQYTPAGMKNKHVERAIREIKEKDRCTRANLPYELPAELEIECWTAQAESINCLPNGASGPNHTPFQLVTKLRPTPRPIAFGTAVLAYARSTSDPQQRAEWGLYLSNLFKENSRIYLPQYSIIVSRRKMIPQTGYPSDWRFIRRPRIIQPITQPSVIDIVHDAPTVLASDNPTTAVNPTSTSSILTNTVHVPNATQLAIPAPPTVSVEKATSLSMNDSESASPVTATIANDQSGSSFENALARAAASLNLETRHRNYGNPSSKFTANNCTPVFKLKAAIIACRISMRQALKDPDPERASSANTAMMDELTQLVDTGTFDPKLYTSLNADQRRRVIPSHMFFKDKFFADGRFQKLKARLVAGGNFVDTSLIGDISSWTVNPINVMIMLNIAAMAQLKLLTIDVKGAFLIPELTESISDLTYVIIDKILSAEILKLRPTWKDKMNPNGTFTMLLKRTLYGLGIAANRWFTHLNATLIKLGFEVSAGDRCCYTRGHGENKLIICTHVDDILCVGHKVGLDAFKSEFEKEYDINVQEGRKHSYIGLDIIQRASDSTVSIGQTGYRRDVLARFAHLLSNSRNDGRVPCGNDIVEETPKNPDRTDRADRHLFMSIIMSVMFLSRFTRPDLSFTVGMLSTHCSDPNVHHMIQAVKMLKYIASSPDMAIVFKVGQPKPTIYADASHATHYDGMGHGCLVIKIGNGIVYCRSYKLKLVTLSSTESEHVVLCDAATLAEWLMSMLIFMAVKVPHIDVLQDNTSTIWLSENDGNFARNKHILIRRNKAKEAVLNGIIKITYTPTATMIADLGTKPLTLRQMLIHMHNMGMMIVTRPNDIYTLSHIHIPALRKMDYAIKKGSKLVK